MSERPPEPPADDEPTADFAAPAGPAEPPVGATREMPLPGNGAEPRFAGQPYAGQPYAGQPYAGEGRAGSNAVPPSHAAPSYPPPNYEPANYAAPNYAAPNYAGPNYSGQPYPPEYPQYAPPQGASPWQAPDARHGAPPSWPPAEFGAPVPPPPPSRGPRRGVVALVTLLVVALVGGVITAIAVGSGDKKPSAGTALPSPLAPNPGSTGGAAPQPSTPAPSASPTLPPLGLIPTPPGLDAIGYHAYSLRLRDPGEVALPGEDAQFTRYGLSRVVGLRALTLGDSRVPSDDYDASINILRFRDAAGAKAELDWSNEQNKKDGTLIALPGLPDVTAFLNTDPVDGISVGAFTTVGRYQVIVIVGGLTPNALTNPKTAAAEAARVLKAVLPDAASIVPGESGNGQGPGGLPSPTQSGTRA